MPDVQYPDDPLSNPSTIRIEDLLAEDAAAPDAQPPVREGLPRSFRMRADRHYVEMLDAPAQKPAAVESPSAAAGRADAAPDRTVVEAAAAAAQAGRDLAQSLQALRASTSLLSDRGPALASTVAANLIRAEVWRATCLLQAARFLRGEIASAPQPVRSFEIISQALKSLEPERRLRGAVFEERISVGDSRIAADEELLVGALSGLLMSVIGLSDAPGLHVTVGAESARGEVVFWAVQDQVGAPAAWEQSLPVVAATRVVAAHGGRIAIAAGAGRMDVRIVLPSI